MLRRRWGGGENDRQLRSYDRLSELRGQFFVS